MIKGIRRGVILILCALLLVVPFSYPVFASDEYTQFTINQFSAYSFFSRYNFRPYVNNLGLGDTLVIDNTVSCTTSTDGTSTSCTIYDYKINNQNNKFFPVLSATPKDSAVTEYLLKYTNPTSYDANNRIRVTKEPIYILYFSNFNTTTNNLHIYTSNAAYPVEATRITTDSQSLVAGVFYLICLKIWANNVPTTGTTKGYVFASVDLGYTASANNLPSPINVLPIYYGSKYTMPEDVYYYIFNEPKPNLSYDATTYDLLENGNSDTQDSIDSFNDTTSDLTSITSDLHNFESGLNTDLTTQMNQIDFNTSGSIISNNNFLLTSNWVRTQYNRMITNNPFGSMISFSLVIGISLLVIGKLRK